MEKAYEQLDLIPDDRIEGYLRSVGVLLNVQATHAPHVLIASQERIVRRTRERLMDELQKKEIVVSHQEWVSYLLQRGIEIYRIREGEFDEVSDGKSLVELLRDIDVNDVDEWMKYVGPKGEESYFRLVVEKTLLDEIQL